MRDSLRSLTKNERMSELLIFLSESLIRLFFCKKTSDSLRKPLSEIPALLEQTSCFEDFSVLGITGMTGVRGTQMQQYYRLIICTQMGKVFRLTRELNLLLSCFWLSALYLPTPFPTRRPDIAPPLYSQYFLICSILTLRRWREGSTLTEDRPPPSLFLSRYD